MPLWFVNPASRRRRRGRRNARVGSPLAARLKRRHASGGETSRQKRDSLERKARRGADRGGAYSRWTKTVSNPRRKRRRTPAQVAATKRMLAANRARRNPRRKRRASSTSSSTSRKRRTAARKVSMAAPKRRKRRRARVAVANPRRRRRRSGRRRSRRARVVVMANPRRRRRRRSRARVANPRRRRSRSRRRARVIVMANPRRRRRRSHRRGRRNPKRTYGLRAIVRARRTVRRTRKRGGSLARIYMRRHKMRSNPTGGGIKGILKMVIPTVLAMGLGRVLAGKIGPRLPFLSSLGANADVALSAVMFGAGYVLTKKVKALGQYRNAILVGLGINAVMGAIKSFAPSVAAQIGLGDSGIYDGAMANYQYDTGEYVQVGEFGEYIQVAGDGGMGDTSGAIEQLAGSGSPRMLAPVGVQAAVQNVPEWTPEFSRDHLQTGIFSNP